MQRLAKEAIKEEMRVASPGRILKYDPERRTAEIQITLRNWHTNEAPVVTDVPVFFPGIFTYNVSAGDECLVIFADACIDGWYQNGTVASPLLARKHDLSDGFAIVGFRSLPNVIPGINLEDLLVGTIVSEIERRVSFLEVSAFYIDSKWEYIEDTEYPEPDWEWWGKSLPEKVADLEARVLAIEKTAILLEDTWGFVENNDQRSAPDFPAGSLLERVIVLRERTRVIASIVMTKATMWG